MLPQPARSTGRRWQLAFLDHDGFKDINDHHPYDVGDHVLQAGAPNTNGCTRDAGRVLRLSQPRAVVARRTPTLPESHDAGTAKRSMEATGILSLHAFGDGMELDPAEGFSQRLRARDPLAFRHSVQRPSHPDALHQAPC